VIAEVQAHSTMASGVRVSGVLSGKTSLPIPPWFNKGLTLIGVNARLVVRSQGSSLHWNMFRSSGWVLSGWRSYVCLG